MILSYGKEMNLAPSYRMTIAVALVLLAPMILFAQETTGEIAEVKGAFFKIHSAQLASLKVGRKGAVQVTVDGESQSFPFAVIAVADDYVVGQANGFEPNVGDKIVFAAPSVDFDRLVDQYITVELSTGRTMEDVTLKEVAKDDDGTPVALLAQVSGAGQTARLSLSTISKVTCLGKVVYESSGGTSDDDNTPMATMPRPESDSSGPSKTRRQILDERKAKADAEKAKAEKEKYDKWLALAQRNRVRVWPEYTQEQCDEATKREKEIAEKLKEEVPNLSLYETKYFVVFSNANPRDIASVATNLDTMHLLVSKMYQVDPDKVYKGKLPVYIFATKDQFMYYERTYMKNNDPEGAAGICHSSGERTVVTTFIGTNPNEFAHVLVHESSHAEIWAYRSQVGIPSWFNEGLADYVGIKIVPQAPGATGRRKQAMDLLRQTGTLGGLFSKRQIAPVDYGISSLLIEFLVRTDDQKFVDLMDLMKAGMSFDEAIVQSYGASPQDLSAAFGRQIGLPQLMP